MGFKYNHIIDSWCFIQVHRGIEVIFRLNRNGKN